MPTPLLPQSVYVPVSVDEISDYYVTHSDAHWVTRVKPQTAYLFTREELEGLLGEAFDAGELTQYLKGKIELPKKRADYIKSIMP